MKYEFVKQHRRQWSVERMCRVLGISPSGYYNWRCRPVSQRARANRQLVKQIKRIHQASQATYGSRRIHAELIEQGHPCGHNRVARLMRQHGIRAKQRRRRRRTTIRDGRHPVAPNRLDRQFEAIAPDRKWLTDISYIHTSEGDLYLAVVLGLYSRKVVGWSMATRMGVELTLSALQMALQQRRPATDLLHHSDRGSQYTAQLYQDLLKQQRCQVSMSGKGNCYDNAPIESFFGTLKTELVYHQRYQTRAEAKTDIFRYIEGFYNRRRRHSALGYQSPEQFEQAFYHSLN